MTSTWVIKLYTQRRGTHGTIWGEGGLSPLNFTIRGARTPVAPPRSAAAEGKERGRGKLGLAQLQYERRGKKDGRSEDRGSARREVNETGSWSISTSQMEA